MARNAQIRAACLLLLLLASLTSASVLLQQTGQLADLQPPYAAAARAGSTSVLQRPKRDTHFPICVFCCSCCNNVKCGICCKT